MIGCSDRTVRELEPRVRATYRLSALFNSGAFKTTAWSNSSPFTSSTVPKHRLGTRRPSRRPLSRFTGYGLGPPDSLLGRVKTRSRSRPNSANPRPLAWSARPCRWSVSTVTVERPRKGSRVTKRANRQGMLCTPPVFCQAEG